MSENNRFNFIRTANPFKGCQLKRVLFSLIFLFTTNYSYALTATTVKWIQGTLPYLTINNGLTKEYGSTALGLLRVKISNGTSYIPSQHSAYPDAVVDISSIDDPIMLEATDTFESIETFVPFPSQNNNNYPKMEFDQLMVAPYEVWQDDDGDKVVPLATQPANLKGNITVNWKDALGRDITDAVKSNPKQVLSGCDAPYALTVDLHKGEIHTQYGDPNKLTVDNKSHTYYFYPKVTEPYVCYAQPNLNLGDGIYAGPAEQWDPLKGFKLQDINRPESNFPTTGSNNLYFKIRVEGITSEEFIRANGATVHSDDGIGVNLELTPENNKAKGHITRVKLKGPSKANNGGDFAPSTFNFYADTGKSKLLYNFKIGRWYIGDTAYNTYGTSNNFCHNLQPTGSFRIPNIRDYTNANTWEGYNPPVPGKSKYYERKISYWHDTEKIMVGGLVSEWGSLSSNYYSEGEFVGGTAGWTQQTTSSSMGTVRWGGGFGDGRVYWNWDWYLPSVIQVGTACVSP